MALQAFKSGTRFKLSVQFAQDAFKQAFDQKKTDIAAANTKAMKDVAGIAKNNARDAVRKGGKGFQAGWPRAVRSNTYPKKGNSMGPAALVYVRSDYAGIFESGGTIGGSPYLWLPLSGVPKRMNRKPIRPGMIRGLISIKRIGKPPLLGIRVRATDARLSRGISLSLLQRSDLSGRNKGGKRGRKTKFRIIPLFVGIRRATIGKKWDIKGAVTRASSQLNSKILANLRNASGR